MRPALLLCLRRRPIAPPLILSSNSAKRQLMSRICLKRLPGVGLNGNWLSTNGGDTPINGRKWSPSNNRKKEMKLLLGLMLLVARSADSTTSQAVQPEVVTLPRGLITVSGPVFRAGGAGPFPAL